MRERRRRPRGRRLTWRRKLLALFLGTVVCLVFLELSLRLTGYAYLKVREYRATRRLREEGAVRILCLGESTTAVGGKNSYPSQLERILNERCPSLKFQVFNGGVPGIDSTRIVEALPGNLQRYRPDLVLAMMGINDYGWIGEHDLFKRYKRFSGIRSLRVVKLFHLLLLDLLAWLDPPAHAAEDPLSQWLNLPPGIEVDMSDPELQMLEELLVNAHELELEGELEKAEEAYLAAVELGRFRLEVLWALEQFYFRMGTPPEKIKLREEIAEAEIELGRRLGMGPGARHVSVPFHRARSIVDPATALRLFREAIVAHPESGALYYGLASFQASQGEYEQAIAMQQRAIELEMERQSIQGEDKLILREYYRFLGECQQGVGDLAAAEESYKRAISLDPGYHRPYQLLVAIYESQGRFQEAIDLLEKGVKANPWNPFLLHTLALEHRLAGQEEQAEEVLAQAEDVWREYYYPKLRESYRRMKEILERAGVQLVCVQYPNRDVDSLKRLFESTEGLIFVDNGPPFREALKRYRFEELFTDRFGGDFGHATPLGNRILAENIAKTILEYFDC